MSPMQARMFVEQVLNMPSIPVAAQYVQANAQHLDDTFFVVLLQMIQEEQTSSSSSWGVSFEDRMAEFMARGGRPASPSQRLQALQMLYDYAMQLRQQMGAQTSVGPSAPAQPQQAIVTCARCRQTQPLACPGFGRHAPAHSVVQTPGGPQCSICGVVFAYAICACGHVTYFTRQQQAEAGGGSPSSVGEAERSRRIEELKEMVQRLISSGKMDQETLSQLMAIDDPEALDAINAMLMAEGAHEIGSGPPLNIEEFYREGARKFELRWALDPTVITMLPVPFSQLDRKTQFYVLFQEWTRRELEGMTALNGGQVDQAEGIFRECIQRGEQIEVKELVARSYEGLMRVAQRRGDRRAEQEWSNKAMAARSG